MNKLATFMFLAFIFSLSFFQPAFARKGVGIAWSTETEMVTEGSTKCIRYGIYNPWDEDINVTLSVSSELKSVITKEESETKLIKSGTSHNNAVPVEFCFEIAKVYEENCLIDSVLCEQNCEEPEVSYEGKIMVMEKQEGGNVTGTTGSATSLGVSVPLKLRVKCNQHPRDWTLVYVVVIVISIMLIALILHRKK